MSPYWSLKLELELDLELDQGTSIQFHSQGMSVQDMGLDREPCWSLMTLVCFQDHSLGSTVGQCGVPAALVQARLCSALGPEGGSVERVRHNHVLFFVYCNIC